ncbi:MAG: methyl-accepting chemotaxis protein [Thermoguttaceae bacterium]
MRWFYNLKTMWKLICGFSVVCVITAVVGYVGLAKMSTINDLMAEMHHMHLLGVSHIKEANFQIMAVGRGIRNVILSDNPEELKKYKTGMERYMEQSKTELKKTGETLVSAEGKAALASAEQFLNEYYAEIVKAENLVAEGNSKEAIRVVKAARGISDNLNKKIAELAQMKESLAEKAYEESMQIYAASRLTVVGMIIGGVVAGLVIGIFIARLISRALNNAVKVLETVAKGDFTTRLEVDTKDEVGQMAQALNAAVESIQVALQETRNVADTLATAAQQLSSASEEISSGAQEQASSLEETASSLEQITSTVKQTTDNAQQANQLAIGARDVAEKGGQVVDDAIKGMGEINSSSKKIADIITAIDEIAFQTNLLALNAAVEAARAGEQGRGFAVVAGEVRNLAQRSAAAAKEIKGLIQDSVRKVENGSELVNQSGKSLQEIVTSVKRVTDIVSEIAAASIEQSSGIEQVNKAVTQMDQVTQANASQTEELSSTAEGLASQAEQLQTLVARFKLDDSTQRPVAKASTTPAHGTAKRAGAKKAVKPAPQKSQPRREAMDVETAVERELTLVKAEAHANGHGGFEEF